MLWIIWLLGRFHKLFSLCWFPAVAWRCFHVMLRHIHIVFSGGIIRLNYSNPYSTTTCILLDILFSTIVISMVWRPLTSRCISDNWWTTRHDWLFQSDLILACNCRRSHGWCIIYFRCRPITHSLVAISTTHTNHWDISHMITERRFFAQTNAWSGCRRRRWCVGGSGATTCPP